jgi:hypothetical protein
MASRYELVPQSESQFEESRPFIEPVDYPKKKKPLISKPVGIIVLLVLVVAVLALAFLLLHPKPSHTLPGGSGPILKIII